MSSSVRSLITLLLVASMGGLAQGQTVLDDFELGFKNFLSFGIGGVETPDTGAGAGIVPDCGTPGNLCAGHDMNFTARSVEPHAFGFGDIGPFFAPTSIDLSGFVGYSIDARFIRTGIADPNALIPQVDFTGISPIKFGVQWDPSDGCPNSMNACSDSYDTPLTITETFQTFTVMFEDLDIPVGNNLSNAQFKLIMLAGDFDPSAFPNRQFDSADFDANSSVDGGDFLTWQRHFDEGDLTGFGGAARFDHGNANIGGIDVLNEIIDGADLAIWIDQFGRTDAPIADWSQGVGRLEYDNIIGILPPESASISAVPEPSSYYLILCCSCLLVCCGRNKRKNIL
jgi:hypothetical protein